MKCPRCSTLVPDDARFCPHCGSTLDGDYTGPVPAPQSQRLPNRAPFPRPARALLIALIAAPVLLMLGWYTGLALPLWVGAALAVLILLLLLVGDFF